MVEGLKSEASTVPGKSQSVTSYADITSKLPATKPSDKIHQSNIKITEEEATNDIIFLNPNKIGSKLVGKKLG